MTYTNIRSDAETPTWKYTTHTRIRNHSPSKWAAANLRLRPCGHQDRL